jgi:ATP-binding protein involved in chromosome partitioning
MGLDRVPPFADGKIIPGEAYGVKVMSIGFLVEPGKPLIWRGPMLHSAIRQFLGDVLWGDLDYFIIDLPPGTGDAQLSLVQSIPLTGGIIVTLPQAVSLEDASRGLYMFKQLNVPILGVVENMSYLELPDGQRMEVFGNGAGEKLSSEADAPFLGKIPMMSEVREGGDLGRPIVAAHPNTPAAQALRAISENLAASLSIAAYENKPEIKLNIIG